MKTMARTAMIQPMRGEKNVLVNLVTKLLVKLIVPVSPST
jgi:hypothetical protein